MFDIMQNFTCKISRIDINNIGLWLQKIVYMKYDYASLLLSINSILGILKQMLRQIREIFEYLDQNGLILVLATECFLTDW